MFRLIYLPQIRYEAIVEHQAVLDAIRSADPYGAA